MSHNYPPTRAITSGPKHHWYGYYDKFQFDPTDRYVLGMEVDFEHRSPRGEDMIRVGMVDLQDSDKWIELGETHAWCWQQGCMLQWLPGSDSKIIWNDREGDHFVSHILDVQTGKRRTVPFPVYTISPDGRTAYFPDFSRINEMRPGYGYAGFDDPNRDVLAPDDSGIWRGDLETGKYELIISLADMAAVPHPNGSLAEFKHYFNHLLVSPDGARLEIQHYWDVDDKGTFRARMLTSLPDGTDFHMLNQYHTSHFIWRDNSHILAWAEQPPQEDAFYLFEDGTDRVEVVGKDVMNRNGHCTYLPGSEWVLNDTYVNSERMQGLYIYHVPTNRRVDIGEFYSPHEYHHEWRCDLHPRFSRNGKMITIDSPHEEGKGRQLYLVDVSEIVGG